MHPELIKMGVPAELLAKRIMYFDGEVNGKWADVLGPAIVLLNARSESEPITLYIGSSGGSFFPGLDMYDIVRHSKAPINGIVYREASSMASVILQACAKRGMMAHARMIVHGITNHADIREEDLRNRKWQKKRLADFEEKNAIVAGIYASRTKQNKKIIAGWLRKDTAFSASEALKARLIDEIL